PSAEKLTQGSVARLKNPGEPDGAPAQIVNCGWPAASAQDAPPSLDTTLVRPLAPPSFQRSCWTVPIRCIGLVGLTATYGSTSASGKFLLPRAVCCATRAAHVALPPSGLSGTRTTAPAVTVLASASAEAAPRAMEPPMGGTSHLANGSLKLDLITRSPPLPPRPRPRFDPPRRRLSSTALRPIAGRGKAQPIGRTAAASA